MLFKNNYCEIVDENFNSLIIQKSKFISYAFKVYDLNQVKRKLDLLKKKHKKANHHCYAYVLSLDSSIQKSSDDGEPSSTAGKPILNQIKINDLTNILIIVTRYFGGVKLGVSGLINAYKLSSSDAISKSKIVQKIIKEEYEVIFKYNQINKVIKIIKQFKLDIKYKNFNIESNVIFAVSKNKTDTVLNAFKKDHTIKIKKLKKQNEIT